MRDKSEVKVSLVAGLAFAFLMGVALRAGIIQLKDDPEFIYVIVGSGAIGAYFCVGLLWFAMGPIISWRRLRNLVLAIVAAIGIGTVSYFGAVLYSSHSASRSIERALFMRATAQYRCT